MTKLTFTGRPAGIMAVFCILLSLLTQAQSPGKISLDIRNEPLTVVLAAIEKQTGMFFSYNRQQVEKVKVTIATYHQKKFTEVLDHLLAQYQFRYKLESGNIILLTQVSKEEKKPAATPGKITGKIIDEENGQPVIGATIRIGNKVIISGMDGSFSLSLPDGSYTATVSYVGYVTKEVHEIDIKGNVNFPLNITLAREKGSLAVVVVKSSVKKESIASLFSRQKNAAELSDGISAQQISATPDKHIGETLKRITGVSTNDNRKVVVRGIAERYNVALLNGSTLPSTDIQERDFEFNLIPTNLVENVVVSKSITPDMPYGFAGGLVQITTKSVPVSSFTSVSAGISVNSRTTGKDFMGYQRGKYDYLGFDDGGRNNFPDGIFNLTGKFDPRRSDAQNAVTAAQVGEQNKRIGGTERLGSRTYQARPSQNYQLSAGRTYSLSKTKTRDLGFVGSLSYRNSQSNDYIANMRRNSWSRKPRIGDTSDVNMGNVYIFNTTWGAILNGGFKTEKHQVNVYNLYTRIFDDRFSRIQGWSHENPKADATNAFISLQEDDRPKFSDLLQNKVAGTHQAGRVKVEWNIARTHLETVELDAVSATLRSQEYINKALLFQYFPQQASEPGKGSMHRDRYIFKERNLSAELSAAYDFRLGKTTHIFKTGFNILDKHAWYDWNVLPVVTVDGFNNPYATIPVQEWGNYMSMQDPLKDLFYNPGNFSVNTFEGKSITRGGFAMFDSKLLPNLRIVGGVRMEYFRTDTLKNGASRQEELQMKLTLDDSVRTRWLPSVNITYTPVKNLNIRASYAETVVRPGLMENARFARFNPNFGAVLRSLGVVTTHIKNYDAKLEWFPGAGEIISAGYFYKYFDKPAEYFADNVANSVMNEVLITNSDWAKVRGWEFELRKNLGFVYDGWHFLKNIYLSGNMTIQKSEVRAREKHIDPDINGEDSVSYTYVKHHRALYGQVPVLYNLGLQYSGKRLGLNLVFNHTGYKTFMTGSDPDYVEYERPRSQLDAQISYKLLKGKMEAKLNVSNLTDAPYRFFINDFTTYELKPDWELNQEWNDRYQYKEGFSEKFEEGYIQNTNGVAQQTGDRKTFTRYIGRTFSFSISYNF